MPIGDYYMTAEASHAEIGKRMEELRTVRERIGKLKSKASTVGKVLVSAGKHLIDHPECLWFERDFVDTQFKKRVGEDDPVLHSKESFDLEKIVALTSDLRSCMGEETKLCDRLTEMGYPHTPQKR